VRIDVRIEVRQLPEPRVEYHLHPVGCDRHGRFEQGEVRRSHAQTAHDPEDAYACFVPAHGPDMTPGSDYINDGVLADSGKTPRELVDAVADPPPSDAEVTAALARIRGGGAPGASNSAGEMFVAMSNSIRRDCGAELYGGRPSG